MLFINLYDHCSMVLAGNSQRKEIFDFMRSIAYPQMLRLRRSMSASNGDSKGGVKLLKRSALMRTF
jgi:hypothetical protein